jgi:hypothetical protein
MTSKRMRDFIKHQARLTDVYEDDTWECDATIVTFIIAQLENFMSISGTEFVPRAQAMLRKIIDDLKTYKLGERFNPESRKLVANAFRRLGKILPGIWN